MGRRFFASTEIGSPAEEVFAWHMRPGAFERLVPPWESVRVVSRDPAMAEGSRVVLELRVGPVPIRWTAVHRDIQEGRRFADEQQGGPFRYWRHEHRFVPIANGRSRLEDDLTFELPLGWLAEALGGRAVERRLGRTFAFRHRVTRGDIDTHRRHGPADPMVVGVTGTSGLIGRHLAPFLTTGGHRVVRLVRRAATAPDELTWNPSRGLDVARADPQMDAIVHLAGAGIADRRWSPAWKREILESRAAPTRQLAESLARLDDPPRTLVCASATGYYGHRPGEQLTESSPRGEGFLADVCEAWERATAPAEAAGIRVVHLRIGIVLSPLGGALQRALPAFRAGIGGYVGQRSTAFNWVALDDVLGAVLHSLAQGELRGPVNVTAPTPATAESFARTLAQVLRRPLVVPVPLAAARLAFGEMANALLAADAQVVPGALVASGYQFRFTQLDSTLRHLLGRELG